MSVTDYFPLSFESHYTNQNDSPTADRTLANGTNADRGDGLPVADTIASMPNAGPPRVCSVRGCSKTLQPDSGTKMCEGCRGRHRIYASTKRAKRKREKDAIQGLAPVSANAEEPAAWVPAQPTPNNSLGHDTHDAGPSHIPIDPSLEKEHTAHIPDGSLSPWPTTVLDPRLFASRTSELAGALTLPPLQFSIDNNASQASSSALPQDATPSAGPSFDGQPHEEEEDPDAPHEQDTGKDESYPPRFCSVKGCKTIMPGDYFFKMCEPCRDRYRAYGITKRAKWKRERVETDAELEKLREAEDKRRADAGLPSLAEAPEEEWDAWARSLDEWQPHPSQLNEMNQGHPLPARMCTVSHCHKLLPGNYLFRRCDQHRLQNRHHSKLKRVREKVSKARGPNRSREESKHPPGDGEGKKKRLKTGDPLFTHEPRDLEHDADGETADEDENEASGSSIDTSGVPAPARGSRRTNHVCSVKPCYNLLSPAVPWKMCDACRENDRIVRRNQRLRQQGKPVPGESPALRRPASKASKKAKTEGDSTTDAPFTNPLVPDGATSESLPADTPSANEASTSELAADTAGASAETESTAEGPRPRKKRAKKAPKPKKEPAAAPSSAPLPGAAPYPPYGQPPYQFPYYMPPPYNMPPYTAAPPKAGTSASAGQPQPPYPPQPYAHYPYAPPPYGPYPYAMAQSGPQYNPTSQTPLQPYGAAPYAPPKPPASASDYRRLEFQPTKTPTNSTTDRKRKRRKAVEPDASAKKPADAAEKPQATSQTPQPQEVAQKSAEPANANVAAGTVPTSSFSVFRHQKDPQPSMSSSSTSSFSVFRSVPPPAQQSASTTITPSPTSESPSDVVMQDAAGVGGSHSRQCVGKSCHRAIPDDAVGAMCDRCRARIKKHQAKAKQRFRLEPRKHVVKMEAP
ncbi:hypothetical protein PLICRDRAFT_57585 [Plicaturopsis crispa FD-325 SS-3]|uniref:Uncharacterized protein n=1 Tax=Plicaturopsis crispa FD-325 SS-3 TaxID=944288 RepID=A0A0C9T5L3_PLICR|nr:hypothetical protein PLICRDRAFT_57585 [Plicaturopsis crispa FD-325 SS-3]